MKRTWIGMYVDFGPEEVEKEVVFRIDVELDDNLSFLGTAWEEEFSEKSKLLIDVKGFIDHEHISFIKTYPCLFEFDENNNIIIDTSQKGHQVIYDGYLDKNSMIWKGEWEIKGNLINVQVDYFEEEIFGGYFEMRMVE